MFLLYLKYEILLSVPQIVLTYFTLLSNLILSVLSIEKGTPSGSQSLLDYCPGWGFGNCTPTIKHTSRNNRFSALVSFAPRARQSKVHPFLPGLCRSREMDGKIISNRLVRGGNKNCSQIIKTTHKATNCNKKITPS